MAGEAATGCAQAQPAEQLELLTLPYENAAVTVLCSRPANALMHRKDAVLKDRHQIQLFGTLRRPALMS